MRILEARFHGRHPGNHTVLPVARLFCDGPRVRLESLVDGNLPDCPDSDSLLGKLRFLIETSGGSPFTHLRDLRSEFWSFTEIEPSVATRLPQTRTTFDRLSVVMPMWNEEDNIQAAVDAAIEVCDELVQEHVLTDYELVLVNDGSTDATATMVDALAARLPCVTVIHHDRNRKLGAALKTGFAAATGDVVLYTDADLPCDFAEVRKALRLMRLYNADVVSAFRNHRTGEGLLRSLYSLVYNTLIRWFFSIRVRDVNFAFKAFRRHILDNVHISSDGSFVDAELLARAQRCGYRIVQFGIDYIPRIRGTSTLSRPTVILQMLYEMLMLQRQIRRLRPLSASELLEVRQATPPPLLMPRS